jgi:hypothetical protein
LRKGALRAPAERAGWRRGGSPPRRAAGTAWHESQPPRRDDPTRGAGSPPALSQKQQGPRWRAFMFLAERAGFDTSLHRKPLEPAPVLAFRPTDRLRETAQWEASRAVLWEETAPLTSLRDERCGVGSYSLGPGLSTLAPGRGMATSRPTALFNSASSLRIVAIRFTTSISSTRMSVASSRQCGSSWECNPSLSAL